MREAVRLPQWGMGMTEATVIAWHKQVGDDVAEDEPLATIEAAKAETELGAPYTGRLVAIVAAADTTVPVGEVLAWIETAP
jgi:pyruvate/2-oxoglutarate dehydrogenase complex dihydrolipoamide acyltransferase (E2) component